MTADERLRQLHADLPGETWGADRGEWFRIGKSASHPYPVAIAALRNALPQLANLAEAADAVAWRRGLTTAERYALIGDLHDALADLEQALNPTGNTQSQA